VPNERRCGIPAVSNNTPSRRGRLSLGPDERCHADMPSVVRMSGKCKQCRHQFTPRPQQTTFCFSSSVITAAQRVAFVVMVQVNSILRPTGFPIWEAACTPLNSLPVGRDLLVLWCKRRLTPKR
jgi:hypothetical protein